MTAFQGTDSVSASTGVWTVFPSISDTIDTGGFTDGTSKIMFPANGLYLIIAWSDVDFDNPFGRGNRIILNGNTDTPCGVLTTAYSVNGNQGRGPNSMFAGVFSKFTSLVE